MTWPLTLRAGGGYLCNSHYALLHCTPEGRITRLCEEGKLYQIACTPDGTIWGTDNQGNVMRYDRQAQRLVTDDMGSTATVRTGKKYLNMVLAAHSFNSYIAK